MQADLVVGCQENCQHARELISWSGAESEGVLGELPAREIADLVVWCCSVLPRRKVAG